MHINSKAQKCIASQYLMMCIKWLQGEFENDSSHIQKNSRPNNPLSNYLEIPIVWHLDHEGSSSQIPSKRISHCFRSFLEIYWRLVSCAPLKVIRFPRKLLSLYYPKQKWIVVLIQITFNNLENLPMQHQSPAGAGITEWEVKLN